MTEQNRTQQNRTEKKKTEKDRTEKKTEANKTGHDRTFTLDYRQACSFMINWLFLRLWPCFRLEYKFTHF